MISFLVLLFLCSKFDALEVRICFVSLSRMVCIINMTKLFQLLVEIIIWLEVFNNVLRIYIFVFCFFIKFLSLKLLLCLLLIVWFYFIFWLLVWWQMSYFVDKWCAFLYITCLLDNTFFTQIARSLLYQVIDFSVSRLHKLLGRSIGGIKFARIWWMKSFWLKKGFYI